MNINIFLFLLIIKYVYSIPIYYGTENSDDINYLFPTWNYIYDKYTDYNLSNSENDNKKLNIMTEIYINFVKNGTLTI